MWGLRRPPGGNARLVRYRGAAVRLLGRRVIELLVQRRNAVMHPGVGRRGPYAFRMRETQVEQPHCDQSDGYGGERDLAVEWIRRIGVKRAVVGQDGPG